MIALDSSAIVAIALDEPERIDLARTISTNECLLAFPTALETYMVLRALAGADGVEFLHNLLNERNVKAVEFSASMFVAACAAFDRYGKGRHRAGLNYGDCMAYAVARANDVPLLFKGDDFTHTDIRAAWP